MFALVFYQLILQWSDNFVYKTLPWYFNQSVYSLSGRKHIMYFAVHTCTSYVYECFDWLRLKQSVSLNCWHYELLTFYDPWLLLSLIHKSVVLLKMKCSQGKTLSCLMDKNNLTITILIYSLTEREDVLLHNQREDFSEIQFCDMVHF